MTSLHGHDADPHNPDGTHALIAGAQSTRMRRHLHAHELQAQLPCEDKPKPRPIARGSHAEHQHEWLTGTRQLVREKLGAAVYELLRAKGISQPAFAKQMGMSTSSLSDRLHGRQDFSLAEGLFIEWFFDTDLITLMEG